MSIVKINGKKTMARINSNINSKIDKKSNCSLLLILTLKFSLSLQP
jgi:hypothetical protein